MKISKVPDSTELVWDSMPLKKAFKWNKSLSLLLVLLLIWGLAPGLIRLADATAGNIDQSIWLLVLLSMISFILLAGLSWWMLQRFWLSIGLPSIPFMVSQFHTLSLWQQICLFWASFALLLLVSMGLLFALC